MSIHHHRHDWLSPEYVDQWVTDWSARGGRRDQLRRVAVALPFSTEEAIEVLDLGCGWGPVSEQILEYRPHATVTLADFSPPMLEHARTRLASYAPRCHFQELDFLDLGWVDRLGRRFDAVVSSLAIHNLREPERIMRVYAGIRELLPPGGCFLNLEAVLPAGPRLAEIERRLAAQADGSNPDRGEQEGSAGSDPRSLQAQLGWLQGAGFEQVDCLWREGNLALLCACR